MKHDLVLDETAPTYLPVSEEEHEEIAYEQLANWSGRLHKIFSIFQGLVAGMALLHIYLVLWSNNTTDFLNVYSSLSRITAIMFNVLVFLSLIGSLHRLVNEYKHFMHISKTEVDYDPEKHRTPYYIAWICSIFYGIAYFVCLYNAWFVCEMHYRNEENEEYTADLSSEFKDKMNVWIVLCLIRAILVILAWLITSMQYYWNIGTIYTFKLQALQNAEIEPVLMLLSDIYKHLFYGNPYLPHGVYVLKDTDDKEKGKKSV